MLTNDSKIRYNSSTDWVQVYHESTWKNWKLGGMNVDPTKMELSQDEFIAICDQGLQSMMSIGAIIHMNNYYCTDYEVIDVNHDGTSNTVDVMAHTQVANMIFGNTADYETSSIRTWINSTYFESFDYEIRELAKIMRIQYTKPNQSSSMYLTDKVKLLGWTELGINSSFIEGSRYPVFPSASAGSSIVERWRGPGNYGNASNYWLRSMYVSGAAEVRYDGVIIYNGVSNSFGVLPVLRF